MCTLALILTVLFVPETYYARNFPKKEANGNRLSTLIGIHQRRVNLLEPNTFLDAVLRPVKVLLKPPIFLISFYYLFTFAWVVGINSAYFSPLERVMSLVRSNL